MFNNFFQLLIRAFLRRYSPTNLWDGAKMAIFGDFFAYCISSEHLFPANADLHAKFTLGPHHVPKYGRHPISDC